MKELTLFDKQNEVVSKIHHDGDMVSLTDLWKEAGSPKEKTPNDWLNQNTTIQLVETVTSMLGLNTVKNGKSENQGVSITVKTGKFDNQVVRTKRGSKSVGGGTWAHKQIALAYAKYLDPKLHVLVNEVFFQRVEEEKNPDLIADRYISTYKKRGKSAEWIKQRLDGKLSRNTFTDTLAKHKVTGKGYGKCTNAIYEPLFGGDAVVIREKYGIEKGQNIRDNLSQVQLVAIQFSETLASDDIEKHNRIGNEQCERASRIASDVVRQALINHRKNVSV